MNCISKDEPSADLFIAPFDSELLNINASDGICYIVIGMKKNNEYSL
jgi:hypothetical protein